MNKKKSPTVLTGPFSQLLTMDNLPFKGSLKDAQLEVVENAGIVHRDGRILETGDFNGLVQAYGVENLVIDRIAAAVVAMPGLTDPHTHLCWAGSRSADYAMRLEGRSYSEIAQSGGGIWDTVTKTRSSSDESLKELLKARVFRQLNNGITTCEVKSGYELTIPGELRMLRIINSVNEGLDVDLIPTCLAAHIKPRDFSGDTKEYLQFLSENLFPVLRSEKLSGRIDIFVEEGAFGTSESAGYLLEARKAGFDLVIHGEQFSPGGVELAVRLGARSVDHLEIIAKREIELLARSEVVAVALPGASMGLGCEFSPARKLLDAGCCLAAGSDWNPGSAPMGDLLVQTAVLGASEKLTNAEQFSAITFRAAHALNLSDRGILRPGKIADFICFPCNDYREIFYQQGMLKPSGVWKNGRQLITHHS